MKTVLATLGVSVLLGVLAALGVMYSGIFNVAATVEDAPPLRWALVTTREASVKRRAQDIRVPPLGGAEQFICNTGTRRAERIVARVFRVYQ